MGKRFANAGFDFSVIYSQQHGHIFLLLCYSGELLFLQTIIKAFSKVEQRKIIRREKNTTLRSWKLSGAFHGFFH